jgi:hypothetical protein
MLEPFGASIRSGLGSALGKLAGTAALGPAQAQPENAAKQVENSPISMMRETCLRAITGISSRNSSFRKFF